MNLDFVLGLVAIVSAWISARRWSAGYRARYGRSPNLASLYSRVDDGPLERERRILIVIILLAVVVAVTVVSRAYSV